jgi:hypothetical protein
MSPKLRRYLGPAIAVALAFVTPPVAKALPPSSFHREFYDADFNWIGEANRFCDGSSWNVGAQSGPVTFTMTEACSGGSPVDGSGSCFVCYPVDEHGGYSCHADACH